MLKRSLRLFTIIFALVLSACADYQQHLSDPVLPGGDLPPEGELQYQMVFLGDLARERERGLTTLESAVSLTEDAGVSGHLALLGDIVGPKGLRKSDDAEKEWLDEVIDRIQAVDGDIYYTPGENELGRSGHFGRLQRLERYFKRKSDKDVEFMPDDACSGPDDEEIFDGVGLIGLNSAWYLSDWRQEEELAEGCDYSDRASFMLAAQDEIRGYRDRVKIVLMHHPLQSNGNRGGRFSIMQHIFPLADVIPGAYIPLPVVGTIARGVQTTAGSRQDLSHLLYKEMVNQITTFIDDEEMVLFLGAHEQNMMYVEEENYHIITAGSSSERGPAGGGNEASFAYGAIGFGELAFYDSGQVYLRFYTVDPAGNRELVFQRKIIEDRTARTPSELPPVPAEVLNDRTVRSPVYAEADPRRSGLYRTTFGRTYRSFYYEDIELPVLYIDTIYGGLEPFKRGGGMTTQSLHLYGGDGRRYQMRSVRKNPAQLLPGLMERGLAADLTRDAFTALHPFAPLTLPSMQEKLGLLHAKPGLYYVPKQPALGNFNDHFGGEMYWMEQRPDDDWSGTGLFGNSEKIVSNGDAREAIRDDWKHQADQRNFLRARLFDLWIGDWDRHRDQWRWATHEDEDGRTIYTPVGRDRDQVYSNFDGFVIRLGAMFLPDARKLRPFDYEYGGGDWRFTNGRWNDRFFLSEMTEQDYREEAAFIVSQMDDATIDAAMQNLPPEIREASLEAYDLDGKLKSRRDALPEFALRYYRHLAEFVDVTATNKDDVVVATGLEGGDLLLEIFDADDEGEIDELYYSRRFDRHVTKEVRVYALDGDDRFVLQAEDKSPILLRLIGGTDDDVIEAEDRLRARAYDDQSGMEIEGPVTDRRSRNNPELNLYRFQEYKPDYTIFSPIIGFNVDDGFVFGAAMQKRNHGFKPDPFATEHRIAASYSTLGALRLSYDGTYNNFFGRRADLLLTGELITEQYVVNFFGFGNDTPDMPREDLDFNRTRQGRSYLFPRLRFRGRTNRLSLEIGPYFNMVEVARRTDGFLGQVELPDRVFTQQTFAGLRTEFSFNNLANPALPDNGLAIKLGAQWNNQLNEGIDRSFTKVHGSASIYRFFGNQIFGIATRIGFEHIDGEFDFFQAAQLGGRSNFRAVRSERLLGQTAVYQNFDFRVRAFAIGMNTVPTIGGILLGLDHGRVWLEGEDSDTWHLGYGGGIWVAPLGATILHLTYFTSDVGNRVTFQAGFPF